jgi:hypothetical protein
VAQRVWIVLLILLSSPLIGLAQQWTEYRPPGAGYRVEFPSQPKLSSQEVATDLGPVVQHNATSVFSGANVLVATHSEYPHATVLSLDKGVASVLAGRTLISQQQLTVSSLPAVRLVLRSSNEVIVILIITRDSSLYQLIYISESGEETAESARFFASVAIVPP